MPLPGGRDAPAAASLEEDLREAAALGDEERVRELISNGVVVNSKNNVNGWTALHWAAARNHGGTVRLLVEHGADADVKNINGRTPSQVTVNGDIQKLLGGVTGDVHVPQLPIVPSYIRYPTYSRAETAGKESPRDATVTHDKRKHDELVVKVRVADCGDSDFYEVELPRSKLVMSELIDVCCRELDVDPLQVRKVRKLPNTVMRRDRDVERLSDYQEIEFVLIK